MKLLKELRLLTETYTDKDIDIEDIIVDYDYFSESNKKNSQYECPGIKVYAYVDNNPNFGIECVITAYINASYEDNRFSYEYGSESGTHDPGSGTVSHVSDIDFSSMKFIDAEGNPIDSGKIIAMFGNESNFKNQLLKAILNNIDDYADFGPTLDQYAKDDY